MLNSFKAGTFLGDLFIAIFGQGDESKPWQLNPFQVARKVRTTLITKKYIGIVAVQLVAKNFEVLAPTKDIKAKINIRHFDTFIESKRCKTTIDKRTFIVRIG